MSGKRRAHVICGDHKQIIRYELNIVLSFNLYRLIRLSCNQIRIAT